MQGSSQKVKENVYHEANFGFYYVGEVKLLLEKLCHWESSILFPSSMY